MTELFGSNIFGNNVEKINKQKLEKTPRQLKLFGEKSIDLYLKNFSISGNENIEKVKEIKENNPEEKFIISASHLHNLDAPAVLKVFSNIFNIQLTEESVLLKKLKYLQPNILITLGNRQNFTPLDYKEKDKNKHGVFNPENFIELEEKMEEGKTPWIAAHPFSLDGKMKKSSIGPVYLASKTGASIIPTALEITGGSVNQEGVKENIKALKNRGDGIYHIGSPIKLPSIDVSIIDEVLRKKSQNNEITEEKLLKFAETHKQLREQADVLASHISLLLPEEKRGYYIDKK
jgi:hypothetical protein